MKRITPILVLILILGVVGISGCTSSSTNTNSNSDYSLDNTTHPEAKNVVVLNSSGHRDGIGNYIIEGNVQNKNSFGVAYIKITATGYDKNGNVVNTNWGYADTDDVASKGKSKFSLYIDDPDNKIVKYDIKVVDADKSLYNYPSDDSSSSTTSTPTSKSGSSSSSSTGSSSTSSAGSGSYIANANTGVFHYSWCHYVDRMNEGNKVPYSSSAAAENAGYRPCKVCNP